MLRSLRSHTDAWAAFRRRRPGLVPACLGLCVIVTVGIAGRAEPFDVYTEPSGAKNGGSDGLSSVIVGTPVESVGEGMVMSGDGWTTTDADSDIGMMSESQVECPDGQCSEPWCPPWNGVPGLINSHLGDACPRLIWSVDALMLWQANAASRPLFTGQNTGLAALDANQIAAPVSVGPRVGLILNLTKCHGLEANWFDVQPFSGSRVIGAAAGPYTMNNIAGLDLMDIRSAAVEETAAFKSFELNWRRRTCSPFTWLAGFRWVEWDQSLAINDSFNDGVTAGTDATSVETGNNLYGGQIGLDTLLWNTGRWLTVNGIAKAGVFYNYQAFQRTQLLGERDFGTFGASENGTAFVGEVGINGTVQVLRWLYWRAGYNFFWLSGVAVPASQLSVTNQPTPTPTSLNLDGSVFLHGVNTGLEARW